MKAMMMTATGGPEVLELREVPDPQPQSSRDLLIRLHAAGVNPVDTKLRSRGTFAPSFAPTILGCDGAGVVEAAGPDAKRFRPGDEVYFCYGGIGLAPGTYAQYAVVDERYVARKPKSLSFVEAAAAPLVLITGWESLFDHGALQSGQSVLVHAGAGGVGHVTIQLAKLHGAQVVTTVSTAEKAEFVQKLGADHVVLYRESDFAVAIQEWTRGRGVDLAIDTVGSAVFAGTFPAVRLFGTLVTLLQPPPDTDWSEARHRNLGIRLELMLTPMHWGLEHELERQRKILEQCAQWFDEGRLRVHVSHTFPLEEAAQAHTLIERGGTIGKIVLTCA